MIPSPCSRPAPTDLPGFVQILGNHGDGIEPMELHECDHLPKAYGTYTRVGKAGENHLRKSLELKIGARVLGCQSINQLAGQGLQFTSIGGIQSRRRKLELAPTMFMLTMVLLKKVPHP